MSTRSDAYDISRLGEYYFTLRRVLSKVLAAEMAAQAIVTWSDSETIHMYYMMAKEAQEEVDLVLRSLDQSTYLPLKVQSLRKRLGARAELALGIATDRYLQKHPEMALSVDTEL